MLLVHEKRGQELNLLVSQPIDFSLKLGELKQIGGCGAPMLHALMIISYQINEDYVKDQTIDPEVQWFLRRLISVLVRYNFSHWK